MFKKTPKHRCLACLRGYGSTPTPVCPHCHVVCAAQSPQLYDLYEQTLFDYIPGAKVPLFVRFLRWCARQVVGPYENASALPPLPPLSPLSLDHPVSEPRRPGRG